MAATRKPLLIAMLAAAALATTAAPGLAQLPDLIATKTNNVGGVATVGVPFTWTIVVQNIGNAIYEGQATFSFFRDELPNTNISYGAVSVSSSGLTGSIICTINASFRLDCFTGSFITLAVGGSVTISFPATASAAGQQVNPRPGEQCRADAGDLDVESNEANNDCADTVSVTTGATGPDLTATKNNSVGGSTEVAAGAFNWTIAVANGGDAGATFASGETLLLDSLPATAMTYGMPIVANQTGISGTGTIACSIVSANLTCTASGGTVTLASVTGGFTVAVPATPTAAGTFANPRAGGSCAANPDGSVAEGDSSNNACADSVTVSGSPDLIATKTNNVGGNATVGMPFTWTIVVENIGNATYEGQATFSFFRDGLPDTNISYGALSVSSSGLTGSISCTINASSLLDCFTNSFITLSAGGSVTISFPATPSAAGTFANPRAGQPCEADFGGLDLELDEGNNDCADTVVAATGVMGPDLTVAKTNDTGGVAEVAGGPWTWSLQVANGGTENATFASGETIVVDNLPSSGLTYGPPAIGGTTGISGTGTILCSIVAANLSCVASGGTVVLAATTGGFTVTVAATPTASGTFANPRVGGVCAVDPAAIIAEGDETNNACSDSVTVANSPDLIATKTNDAGGIGVVGTPFTWSITVENVGLASFMFPATFDILRDDLPNSGVTYGPVGFSSSGVTGTMTCSIDAASTLHCFSDTFITVAPGGSFTVDFDAVPTAAGNLVNPRIGGICRADSNNLDAETDETNNNCSDTVSLTPEAALSLSKTDSPDPVSAGASLTYTLAVSNAGPSSAESVMTYDVLPAGTSFDSVSSDVGCTQPVDLEGQVALLDGTQVVPPSGSPATGRATLVLDTTTDALRFVLSVSGMTDTIAGASLRLADGTLVHVLSEGTPSFDDGNPIVGFVQLSPAESAAFQVAGSHRIRIDTDADPGGAIAGTPAATAATPVACDLGTIAASSNGNAQVVVDVGADQAGASLVNVSLVDATTDDPNELALPAGALRGAQASASTGVVAETDLSITKIDLADPVVAGQDLSYLVTVTNNGPSDSTGASVSDSLPAGTSFVSSPDGCTEAGGTVTCPIGALGVGASAGASFTVTVGAGVTGALSNTATVTANETDPNAANDSATEGTTVLAIADLGLVKTDSPDPVLAGAQLVYTLTVTNNGPSSSTGSSVSDPLPAGTSFVSSADGCTEAAGTVTCPFGGLGVGASANASFTVAVASGVTGTIVNTATLLGNEIDDDNANQTATATTTVQVEADLGLVKTDSPDPVVAGAQLTYTLMVTNNGPSDSTGSSVSDPLPAGTSFASSPDGCTEAGGTVTCAIGSLVSGANQAVQFTVDVASSTVGPIVNTATVSGNETDPVSGNDSAMASTTVDREADLQIAQSDAPDPVTAGTGLTYTLDVTNAGPSDDLSTVTVTDNLPGGVTFGSASGAGWTCAEAGGVVTCARAALAVGAAPAITVSVTVDAATTGTLTNTASVSSPTTDPSTGANDTDVTETTTVESEADLAIVKTDSADPVAGATFDYTLSVTNAGPSDARNVVATDTLPGVLQFDTSTTCTEAGGTVTCDFGTIAAGATEMQTFTVTIVPPPPPTVVNTATVTSDDPDPELDDNSDDEQTSLDALPPQVVVLDSIAGTGDGELEDCETANASIQSLVVSFDEPVRDPPGDGDADDVTNPANHQLVSAGPDRTFQTAACGGALGDDVLVPAVAVTYDAAAFVATVAFGGVLPDDLYRFAVCSGVTDLAGNPLDGDGDGAGGDDFVRGFRVDAANRFANGHLDCDLGSWTTISTNPAEIVWSPDDHEASGASGSVAVTNLTASTEFRVEQCADLAAFGAPHDLAARVRVAAPATAFLGLSRGCAFFDAAGCAGATVGTTADVVLIEDTGGVWQPLVGEVTPPLQARSALCSIVISAPDGDGFDVDLDAIELTPGDATIFADGFESGDTSAWSATIGEP